MNYFLRGRLANKYIFFEMLPTFLMGVVIFLLIILMFQSFRMTEYIIVHGASLFTIAKILLYLSISFLPVIMPMSLLFAVLLTYGRLSGDSEIVAFKALGLNILHLLFPALIISILVGIISLQTSYHLAPWGNRQMEIIIHQLGQSKPGATIREGVFSEGFFNMVVYANEVDSKNNHLKKVFIYDERNERSPLTIIAHEGQLIQESNITEQKAFLRLFKGNIHRTENDVYTKIDFDMYDINLYDPVIMSEKQKTPLSYNINDLEKAFQNLGTPKKLLLKLKIEYHRRTALSFLSLIFAILGVGLGTTTNKRSAKSSGFVLSIGLVVAYWILYATMENFAKSEVIPVALAVWVPNIIFSLFALSSLKKAST